MEHSATRDTLRLGMPPNATFLNTDIVAAINEMAECSDDQARAVGHNFRWEERLGPDRIAAFEQHPLVSARLGNGTPVTDFKEAYKVYREERLEWDGHDVAEISDTFRACNNAARFETLPDQRRVLVRITKIGPALKAAGLGFDGFSRAVDLYVNSDNQTDQVMNAQAVIEEFVQAWNAYDRRMPAFCGFLSDVESDASQADWPHAIRDRLGLGHFDVPPGAAPLPVMLLRYSVEDALRRATRFCKAEVAMRVPTVLESNMFHYFYPAPTELPFGRTVYLGGGLDESLLTCELVHLPVDITVGDVWKVGMVEKPIPNVPLAKVRDDHLEIIRVEAVRDDFGEMMNHG